MSDTQPIVTVGGKHYNLGDVVEVTEEIQSTLNELRAAKDKSSKALEDIFDTVLLGKSATSDIVDTYLNEHQYYTAAKIYHTNTAFIQVSKMLGGFVPVSIDFPEDGETRVVVREFGPGESTSVTENDVLLALGITNSSMPLRDAVSTFGGELKIDYKLSDLVGAPAFRGSTNVTEVSGVNATDSGTVTTNATVQHIVDNIRPMFQGKDNTPFMVFGFSGREYAGVAYPREVAMRVDVPSIHKAFQEAVFETPTSDGLIITCFAQEDRSTEGKPVHSFTSAVTIYNEDGTQVCSVIYDLDKGNLIRFMSSDDIEAEATKINDRTQAAAAQ